MNNQKLYLHTKPSKLFLKAALPGGISMLVSSFYMVFDSIFVGKFLGTVAFAALGIAIPVVIINFALADLIGVGASVPISILLGRGEDKKANNYFTCASIMIVLTGLLTGLLMFFGAPLFVSFMGADGELAELAVRYIRIYAAFSPVITMTFAVDNFLRISGKTKTSMVLNIVMSVGTVILESVFILVFQFGIVGAALGATVAMLFCSLVGFAFFVKGNLQLKLTRPQFSMELICEIVKNGAPAFLTNVSGRIFSILMNIMLLNMGGVDAVAIYGVLMTVSSIVEQLLYGVLDSLQPAIGYNYGAEEYGRVKAIEKYCMVTGAMISVLFGILIFSIPHLAAIPFLEDLSLLPIATHALRLFCISCFFRWFSHAIQSFFIALERPLPAMFISLSTAFFFPLLLIFVLLPLRLDGLWLNYSITSILASFLATVLIWKAKNKLFDHKDE